MESAPRPAPRSPAFLTRPHTVCLPGFSGRQGQVPSLGGVEVEMGSRGPQRWPRVVCGGGGQASSLGPRRPRGGGRPTPAREPLRRGDLAWKVTLVGALRFHSLTTLSFVSMGPWKATVLQVALNSRELGTPGLQGPWPLVAPGALQAQPCRTRPSDSVERIAKSRHSPGLPVSASLPPTAASRLDSAERLSLTTASFGLPGYRAAAPLSSGTWGNCWSASFAGATASGSGLVLQRSMRGPASSSHLLGGWAHACQRRLY